MDYFLVKILFSEIFAKELRTFRKKYFYLKN